MESKTRLPVRSLLVVGIVLREIAEGIAEEKTDTRSPHE